jgi:hypothetical protein
MSTGRIFELEKFITGASAATGDHNSINTVLNEIDVIVKQVMSNRIQLLYPFHVFSLKLFDRIFGEDTTSGEGVKLPAPWVKGNDGMRLYFHK